MKKYYAESIKVDLINWICDGNLGFDKTDGAIANEPLYGPKMRRVDLLLISASGLHALEIKREKDSLSRLSEQISEYTQTFDKTSVVLTKNHLRSAKSILPRNVGIILFEDNNFTEIRPANCIKRLNKKYLATLLPKSVLLQLVGTQYKKNDTFQVREIVVQKVSLLKLKKIVIQELQRKYRRLFQYYLLDTQNGSTIDDTCMLTLKMPMGFHLGSSSCNVSSYEY